MKQFFSPSKTNQILTMWVIIVIAVSTFVYFYQHSIKTLFDYWNDYGTYSHGYLTILLSTFLLYECVKSDRFKYSGPSNISLMCLAAISLVWLVAYVSNINTIQMLCLPFFIFFIITYFIGLKNAPILFTPVFILLFTIPLWSLTLPVLQNLAVYVTNVILTISTLDYQIVDNAIIFSRGIFEIEESCSGLRYLLVGILLSIVYGFLNYKSIWSTLLLVIAAIAIMLIGNFIRILLVISLGVIKGMDYPLVQDHESLGWVLFAILLLPLFVVANFIKPDLYVKDDKENLGVKEPHKTVNKIETSNSKRLVVFFGYLIAISAAPLFAGHLEKNVTRVASLESGFNEFNAGWKGSGLSASRWEPNYIYYSDYNSEKYVKNEKAVTMHVFLYTKQNPKGELINANNQLVDKHKWRVSDASAHELVISESGSSAKVVNKQTIQSTRLEDCLRVWYWYEVNGVAHTKKIQVKMHEAFMSFKGVSGSALFSISTHCDNDSDLVLSEFLFANYNEVKNLVKW